LRYPRDKGEITGYGYEAWHYRYVGVELATELYESGQTLEEYYGKEQVLPGDEDE
jgi:D-alanyl-D-alanine carboxypeptidase